MIYIIPYIKIWIKIQIKKNKILMIMEINIKNNNKINKSKM